MQGCHGDGYGVVDDVHDAASFLDFLEHVGLYHGALRLSSLGEILFDCAKGADKMDIYAEITHRMIAEGKPGKSPGENITLNQCRQEGGHVRKGEKARMVVFWKWPEKEDEGTGEVGKRPCLRDKSFLHFQKTIVERAGEAKGFFIFAKHHANIGASCRAFLNF